MNIKELALKENIVPLMELSGPPDNLQFTKTIKLETGHTDNNHTYLIELHVTEEVLEYESGLRESDQLFPQSLKYLSLIDLLLSTDLYRKFAHNLHGPSLVVTLDGKVTSQEFYIRGKAYAKVSKFEADRHTELFKVGVDEMIFKD
jgi:hypothetical protein